jgi:putative ABC transport system permease protein
MVAVDVRTLRHGKAATGLAVATIALVICSVTAITSVLMATLIDRGPYRAPSRVIGLHLTAPTLQYPRIYFPHEDYLTLRDGATGPEGVFDALLPLGVAYVMMTGSGEPAHLNAGVMPGETFSRLGVPPLIGRALAADDDRADAPSVIVLSEEVWRQSFGGDPAVIGRIVRIDDRPHEIVGVMPRRFTWGVLTAWLPMRMDLYGAVTGRFVQVSGWLRDGVPEAQARSRMNALFTALAAERGDRYPASPAIAFTYTALPAVRDDVRQGLLLLLAAVTLLAVVGCVNVAALLLARATGRLKELSVRASLGASRGDLVREQLAEAILIGTAGAAIGIGLAYTLLPPLVAAMPPSVLPLGAVVALDGRVLWSMAAITIAISLACGALPALLVTRPTIEHLLRQTPIGSSSGLAAGRMWGALIGIEVAVAMSLLVLTAVFGRGLLALRAEPLQYSPDRVVTLGVTASEQRYPTDEHATRFLQQAVERIRSVPGVDHVAVASSSGPRNSYTSTFTLAGRPSSPDDRVGVRVAGADFFRAYRIPTVRGRALEVDDERAGRPVTVVNEAFARQFGGDADVLGRHVRVASLRSLAGGEAPAYEIVGVVRDVPNDNRRPGFTQPEVSVPVASAVQNRNWFLVVRATSDIATDLVKPIQKAVWAIDPDQAFRSIRTESDMLWVARYGWPEFRARLLALFGVLALTLTAAGGYGIVAYVTTRQARDIGIRLALGSNRAAIVRDVLLRGLRPAVVGMTVGAGMAAAGGVLLRSVIGGVSPWDLPAYGAAIATLLVVITLACYVPARRASRIDPNVVLRGE